MHQPATTGSPSRVHNRAVQPPNDTRCEQCGTELPAGAETCPKCGHRQAPGWGNVHHDWLRRYTPEDLAGKPERALLATAVIELSKIRMLLVWVWVLVPIAATLLVLVSIESRGR